MLVKLLPEQISRYWEYIKWALMHTLPEGNRIPVDLNTVLEGLLSDAMQCWWFVQSTENDYKVLALVITTIFEDNTLKKKHLRLFAVYGFDDLPMDAFQSGFYTLSKYAQGKGCQYIDAFTDVPYVAELCKKFGGDASMTYLKLEVQ